MQFDDVFRGNSRGLMQIVDILRDDGRDLAGAVEARQRAMAAAGLCPAELLLHGEAAPPQLIARLLAVQELIEWDRPIPSP